MTLIKVQDGTKNKTAIRSKMHKSRRKILDVLNGEYRKDTFGTHIVTKEERDTKAEAAKKLKDEKAEIFRPVHSCPKCNAFFGTKLDKKFYYRTNHCFNCQLKFESELRANGVFGAWEEMKMIQNELSIFRDHREKFVAAMDEINPYVELVTDSGYINKFEISDEQFLKIKSDIQSDIDFIDEKTPIMIERLSVIVESLLKLPIKELIAENDIIFNKLFMNAEKVNA